MYSLGCILFEWEIGRPPFGGSTVEEIAERHFSEIPRIGGLFRKTRFGVEDLILRCLQKNPQNRFKDYSELLAELKSAAARRHVLIEESGPEQRYKLPVIGGESITEALGSGVKGIPRVESRDARLAVTEFSEIEPFLREAEALMGLK